VEIKKEGKGKRNRGEERMRESYRGSIAGFEVYFLVLMY